MYTCFAFLKDNHTWAVLSSRYGFKDPEETASHLVSLIPLIEQGELVSSQEIFEGICEYYGSNLKDAWWLEGVGWSAIELPTMGEVYIVKDNPYNWMFDCWKKHHGKEWLEKRKAFARKRALEKLTEEEVSLLGLKN